MSPLPAPAGQAQPPAAYDEVDARILSGFPALVATLGGDASSLLRQAGLDPARDSARPTYRQAATLMAQAATTLQCPDFGMRLALAQSGTLSTPLLKLGESCPTLGDALEQISAHSYAHSPAAAIWLRPTPSRVMLGFNILLDALPQRAQVMEQVLLASTLIIRRLMGGRVRVRQICFRHQPISPTLLYRRHFGCSVQFGQQVDALIFRTEDLSCPTARPDEDAFSAALAYIEAQSFGRPPLHAHVRGAVMNLLGTESCRNEIIAAALHLHPRAMHRQLVAEGTSFQRIKNEVRRDLALYYLEQTRLDLTLVSARLGFAEQSALTLFCRKWLGDAPSHIRAGAVLPVQNEQV